MAITDFADVEAEFDAFDDWDDRYRLIIALGQALPAMDPALKTDATKVRGCASQVWLHPSRDGDVLRFAADSDAAIVKGLVALVLMLADGRRPAEIDAAAIKSRLDGLGLAKHLSSNRTQGLASMIGRIEALARAADGAPESRRA
ncbi:SufE family protein [Sandarakinorhabdus sp.]|jgi:cysteine desulfuration protein SufE|uniref:SufE family protein n=1 Tax=Sandarakinorhabdus sp. TaxID=1916663 RepID=UPI003340471B